ncbi:MAG: hypothetical protein Q9163_005847 [Psora crenata]
MPEMQDHIFRIIQFFEPPLPAKSPPPYSTIDYSAELSCQQLMLSHWDIIGLIEALHPDAASSEVEPRPAVLTYAPSTTSTATLRPGPSDAGRSKAPSTSHSHTDSSSNSNTIFGDGEISDGQSPQDASAEPIPGGDDHFTGASNEGPTDRSLSPRLGEICNKIRMLARRRADTAISPHDWTLFEVSAHDLRLRLSRAFLPPLISGKPAPGVSEAANGNERECVKYRIIEKALLLLLDPSGTSLPRDRSAAIASAACTEDPLQTLIETALATAMAQYGFNAAHQWWHALAVYKGIKSAGASAKSLQSLSRGIADNFGACLRDLTEQRRKYELLMQPLELRRRNQQASLKELAELRKSLRVKMWYVSDVKNSSPYEDALLVTKALRAMAKAKRGKQPGSIANWARQRLRGSAPYDRADKQALEALCAPKHHGGTAKLADEQVELTSRWLTKNSIENFCKGEERIHRFCYEVQKSVGKLAGMNLLESPVLWSSHLFRSEKASFDTRSRQPSLPSDPYPPMASPLRSNDFGPVRSSTINQTHPTFSGVPSTRAKGPVNFTGALQITGMPQPFGASALSSAPRYPYAALSSSQMLGHLSPPMTPVSPKLGEVFSASVPSRTEPEHKPKRDFVENIKQRLTALIISDLGYLLWISGSETDVWMTRAAAQAQVDHGGEPAGDKAGVSANAATIPVRNRRSSPPKASSSDSNAPEQSSTGVQFAMSAQPFNPGSDPPNTFPYSCAYSAILKKMSLTQDPSSKLQMLCDLEDLIWSFLQERKLRQSMDGPASAKPQAEGKPAMTSSKIMPRTKATSLEEVIANCTERRASTLKREQPRQPLPLDFFIATPTEPSSVAGADEVADELLSIFRDPNLRPATLYRDLQFIAAFIPPSILDQTVQGKSFWDAGLAALALKEDFINTTIRRANEITNHHLNTKLPPQFPNMTEVPPSVANTTLRDAAELWLIAAKEGSPLAARELALFYLTHPDLLRRTVMPFSKAKDVFASMSPVDRSSVGALDPLTFSVVMHWMEVASSGGDNEAKEFLRANGALVRAS